MICYIFILPMTAKLQVMDSFKETITTLLSSWYVIYVRNTRINARFGLNITKYRTHFYLFSNGSTQTH